MITASTLASWRGVLIAAAVATLLALAAKWGATAAGLERMLFGFGTGIDVTDVPATATRSATYPLFLVAARPIGSWGILAIQTFLYFAAGILLFARLALALPPRRWVRGFVALAGIAALANPRVLEYPLSIGEEALFIPAMLALMAAAIAHLERPRLALAAAAGLFAGLAIGIRPIGLAFVPMLLLALILPAAIANRVNWGRALLGLLLGGGVALAAAGAERIVHARAIGDKEQGTVLGINLIAKIPFILEPGDITGFSADAAEAELLREVERVLLRSKAFAAEADATLTRWDARQFFTNYLEFAYQLRGQAPELVAAMRRLGHLRKREYSGVTGDLALAVIAKRPLAYANRVFGNFVRFLILAEFPGTGGRREAELAARRADPSWGKAAFGDGYKRTLDAAAAYRLPAWVLRLAHAAALLGIAMALWVAVSATIRRRPWPFEAAAGLAIGAGLIGYLLACAATINVQVRYVMTVWPMIVALALLPLMIPARRLHAQRREGGPRAQMSAG